MMKHLHRPASAIRQRGQSLVEFLVVAIVLVPLFLAVPLVGKYIDLMQTAEQASRYAAFEGAARNSRSTWKSDDDLAVEVRRRFFSNSDAPVKTGDAAGDFSANRNPLWVDHTGSALIDDFASDVLVGTAIASKQAIPAAVYRSALNLSNTNLYNAGVLVSLENVANFPPFDEIDLDITRNTVLLTDAWTGFSRDDARHRIENSGLAMYPIEQAKVLVDAFGEIPPLLFDPALKIGNFDWDIVPCDRLIGGC